MARVWRALAAAARRIAGVPDYDAYVAHLTSKHPERAVPSRAAFVADRLQARYRAGGGRCC
ncbi:MAG TPA: YbdD/YjiX family protein [Rhodanobacteraceae bacterium]